MHEVLVFGRSERKAGIEALTSTGAKMSSKLLDIERQVLEKLLTGNHPFLQGLRVQLRGIEVVKRKFTGTGFFTFFRVDPFLVVPGLAGMDFEFGNVVAEMENLERGAGFFLYIVKGAIRALEGNAFDGKWPGHIGRFKLFHINGDVRDLARAYESRKRKVVTEENFDNKQAMI